MVEMEDDLKPILTRQMEIYAGFLEHTDSHLGRLVDALEELSRSYSVCLALEDLHWSDLATTELIGYLSKRLSDLKVLLIGTYRPAELMTSDHPLRPILLDMQAGGVAIEIALEFLTEGDIQSYIDLEFPGHQFPQELSGWIARKTEGNPLFLVDLLRHLVERQALVKRTNWELATRSALGLRS